MVYIFQPYKHIESREERIEYRDIEAIIMQHIIEVSHRREKEWNKAHCRKTMPKLLKIEERHKSIDSGQRHENKQNKEKTYRRGDFIKCQGPNYCEFISFREKRNKNKIVGLTSKGKAKGK